MKVDAYRLREMEEEEENEPGPNSSLGGQVAWLYGNGAASSY